MENAKIRTLSGRALEDLTIEAILAGELSAGDFRISGETLRRSSPVFIPSDPWLNHHYSR